MKANYDGKCSRCGVEYSAGTEIVAIPPKGRRRVWITRHSSCHQLSGKVKFRFVCPVCGGAHPRAECLDRLDETVNERKAA